MIATVCTNDCVDRYKMAVVCEVKCSAMTLKHSADGITWRTVLNQSGFVSDRSTIFYNPFRSKWVYSIKGFPGGYSGDPKDKYTLGRARQYVEGDSFVGSANWSLHQPVNWTSADFLDPAVGCLSSPGNSFTQLCVGSKRVGMLPT